MTDSHICINTNYLHCFGVFVKNGGLRNFLQKFGESAAKLYRIFKTKIYVNYAVNALKDRTVFLRQGKGRGNSQSIFALSAVGRCAINAEMSITLEMYSTLATVMFMCSTTGSLQSWPLSKFHLIAELLSWWAGGYNWKDLYNL